MQGDGLWKNKKGEKYVGNWKNNKAHGYGVYATEKSHYQGSNFITQVNSLVLLKTGMACKISPMVILIRATMGKESHTVQASIFGPMERHIRDNLWLGLGKATGRGSAKVGTNISAISVETGKMVGASTIGRMETFTKEISAKI